MKFRLLSILTVCSLLAAAGLLPSVQAQTKIKTFRMVPQSDLKFLDPIFTTNYVTRNYSHMVFDTLFAVDEKGVPQPQMVDKYSSSPDGKQWSFTLRPGLKFHDGSAVTATDAVASLQRWATQDNYGRAMTAAGAQWKVVDKNTFTLTLKDRFGLVLEALSKSSSVPPVIMPEWVIKLSGTGTGTVNTVIGSGPYIFKRDEWVPGNKVVFVRNPHYVGRSEPPSFLAGNKTPAIDRVEWVILPDANSAVAALKNGEVDMIEQVPPDYVQPLRTDPNIKVGVAGSMQASLVVNQLHPPFNNPKARRALLHAVNQEKFLAAMGHPEDLRMKYCPTFFICGDANQTSAGAQPFNKPDIAKAKQLLAESGYKGEKVVVLLPTDYPSLNGAGLMAVQTMKEIGMNVDVQSMDWPSIVSRRVKKDAPEAGGWSAYATQAIASSADSPLNNFMLGAACGNSMPGWPCDKQLDELRTAWMQEVDPAKRRKILVEFHERAYEVVPYLPLGQFSGAFAMRKSVKHIERQNKDIPVIWALDK